MTKSTSTIEIQAPAEEVWAYMLSEKMNDIWKDWTTITWTSDGPIAVGSTAHVVGVGRNTGAEWDVKVTELVKDQRMTMRAVGTKKRALNSTNSFILEPTAKGTKATYSIDYEMKYSVLGKLIDALVARRELEKADYKMLENLKKALEG
jgi:ligand-binding SRPBCC domain-containing protein